MSTHSHSQTNSPGWPVAAAPAPEPTSPSRLPSRTLLAPLFLVAGLTIALYPSLRPYAQGATDGPEQWVNDLWVYSHLLGVVGFVALAAAALILASAPGLGLDADLATRRLLAISALLMLLGLLPYYGAEIFGLRALGGADVADPVAAADALRYHPVAVTLFVVGLGALAVLGVGLARLAWQRAAYISAVLVGVGVLAYLPQYLLAPGLRMAHGVALGIGLATLAWILRRPRGWRPGGRG